MVQDPNKLRLERLSVDINRESQKAGDNATQLQAQTINIYQGIDEKRAREIFNEMYLIARKDLTEEAYTVAQERVNVFESKLIPKMEKVDGALNAFADPSFQLLLTEAHKSAAASDRELDYELLSELLIHRIEKGEKRKVKAGITKAVEIVDEIDDEALNGLTLAYVVQHLSPLSGNIREGLNVLNDLYKTIIVQPLPTGMEWMEHLDILDAVRVSNFSSFKKLTEYLEQVFSGAFKGFLKDSEELKVAEKQLSESDIPLTLLVENEIDPRFMRLQIINQSRIDDISFVQHTFSNGGIHNSINPLTEEQKKVLKDIFNTSSLQGEYIEEYRKAFIAEIEKYQYISETSEWWDKIPHSFSITSVGKVLAHANAKRLNPEIPKLDG